MTRRLTPAREGDEGEDIAFAQLLLGIVPASGTFDTRTTQRVKGFQRANGLFANGALTPETVALLMERADL